MSPRRIFLIHATAVAVQPINDAFARHWPEAQLSNLLDDSLSRDLAAEGRLTDAMKQRFLTLARYAKSAGAEGILFTCSAFGEAIELCQRELDIPVLKPNEAMIDEAVAQARRIAIVATFAPAVESMVEEFAQAARAAGRQLQVASFVCPEALDALRAGNPARHDALIRDLVARIADQDLICFAQFSMIDAAAEARPATALDILTTPDSAVLRLRRRLAG